MEKKKVLFVVIVLLAMGGLSVGIPSVAADNGYCYYCYDNYYWWNYYWDYFNYYWNNYWYNYWYYYWYGW
nr:hypothetical protein [uncultured Methanospirillum sp.]